MPKQINRLQVINTATSAPLFTVTADTLDLARLGAHGLVAVAHGHTGQRYHVGICGIKDAAHNTDGNGPGHFGVHLQGLCAVCGGAYAIRKDGTLLKHGKLYGRRSAARCKGSLRKPVRVL